MSPATFAEAEKLAQVTMSAAEREMAAESWRRSMAPLLERRVGPRKVAIDAETAPATIWNPVFAGDRSGPAVDRFVRSASATVPLPASDADIAFAPVTRLSRWIEQKKLSSERLTNVCLRTDSAPRSKDSFRHHRDEGPGGSNRRNRPTRKSPPESIADHSTEFPTV